MLDFGLIIRTFLEKLNHAFITIQNYITIKIIYFLGPKFKIYITVLNKKSYNKKKFSNLNLLLKSLKKRATYN